MILYPLLFIGAASLLAVATWYRFYRLKPVVYRYPLVSLLRQRGMAERTAPHYIVNACRMASLILLVFLLARPQVRSSQQPHVDGIDIMLVLDISESMLCFDDLDDQRSRFEVAQQEAIQFIRKRPFDALGLVLFAQHVVSRCPLTVDKKMMEQLLHEVAIGQLSPNGTMLSTALLTAAHRLRLSTAPSKVIILLTDGEPTPGDIPVEQMLSVIKKLGIKVYTIGVGSEQGGYFRHPWAGIVNANTRLNRQLLESIAQATGGQAFYAQNPADMKAIYSTIDTLEKSAHNGLENAWYQDFFMPLLVLVACCLMAELILSTVVWFRL